MTGNIIQEHVSLFFLFSLSLSVCLPVFISLLFTIPQTLTFCFSSLSHLSSHLLLCLSVTLPSHCPFTRYLTPCLILFVSVCLSLSWVLFLSKVLLVVSVCLNNAMSLQIFLYISLCLSNSLSVFFSFPMMSSIYACRPICRFSLSFFINVLCLGLSAYVHLRLHVAAIFLCFSLCLLSLSVCLATRLSICLWLSILP